MYILLGIIYLSLLVLLVYFIIQSKEFEQKYNKESQKTIKATYTFRDIADIMKGFRESGQVSVISDKVLTDIADSIETYKKDISEIPYNKG